jgi:nucleoside-diphosphate-sugar epimerase
VKRVLITGGTGFVGANLARYALQAGHDVHLLVRRNHDPWRIQDLQSHLRRHVATLEDRDAVHSVLRDVRPDIVFHLAVHGAYSWQTDVDAIIRTNFLGTIALVEACVAAGCGVVVNTGSSSEYGYKDHAPRETELIEPNSHYAVAKAAATLYCRFSAEAHHLRIPTLRLYSVYGPYEDPRRLIPALLLRALEGNLPPMANPQTARDYVYIDDVVNAYWRAATAELSDSGAVYNVGTGMQTTLLDIVEVVRDLTGISAVPVWGALRDRAWDTNTWRSDPTRIMSELNWRAETDLATGLRRMLQWFSENPEIRKEYARRQNTAS